MTLRTELGPIEIFVERKRFYASAWAKNAKSLKSLGISAFFAQQWRQSKFTVGMEARLAKRRGAEVPERQGQ